MSASNEESLQMIIHRLTALDDGLDRIESELARIQKFTTTIETLERRIRELEQRRKKARRKQSAEHKDGRTVTMMDIVLYVLLAKKYVDDVKYAEPLKKGLMPRSKLQKLARIPAVEFSKVVDEAVLSGRIKEIRYKPSDRHPEGFTGTYYQYMIRPGREDVQLVPLINTQYDAIDLAAMGAFQPHNIENYKQMIE